MGISLSVKSFVSLAPFKILSLILAGLITICLGEDLLGLKFGRDLGAS